MPAAPKTPPPGTYTRDRRIRMSDGQTRASLLATAALFAAGVFTLREFLPALVWAVIVAIAVQPLFLRAARRWPGARRGLLPAAVILAIVVVFIVPLTLVTVPLAQDAHGLAAWIERVKHDGVAPPPILGRLPAGDRLTALWQANLGQPDRIDAYASHVAQGNLVGFARRLGAEALHRAVLLGFMLLALFLLLRESDRVAEQMRVASRRAFGPAGENVGRQVVLSVHGTVNGLVLVGLVEGAIMTVAYFVAGTPHASLFGLFTALLAMVPFGAPVTFGAATLALLATSKVVAGVAVAVLGSAVTFIADHFFRPVLIGGATRLPFLWVLLGILGGVKAFGLMGLFLGPAVLAALILLWREWVGSAPGPINPEPQDA